MKKFRKAALRIVAGRDCDPPAPEQPKRKRGRRANPLRAKSAPISRAVTIAGKMHCYAELCEGVSEMWLEKLRSGAESARIVAKEIDQAAEHMRAVRKGGNRDKVQRAAVHLNGDNQRPAKAAEAGTSLVEFVQTLRAYVVQEFARGKDVDQIFGELEDSYRRLEKALEKWKS
jgi:hypothetical protein